MPPCFYILRLRSGGLYLGSTTDLQPELFTMESMKDLEAGVELRDANLLTRSSPVCYTPCVSTSSMVDE